MYPKNLLLAALIASAAGSSSLLAQGTAFTYQGQLATNGAAANGLFDFQLTIYDAVSNGDIVAGPMTNPAVSVTNGLFTLTPDFGSNVFTGAGRWLAVGVRPNGNTGAFTNLTPRQAVTPSPYAIFAPTAGTVSGTVAVSNLPAGVALLNGNQTFSGVVHFTNAADVYSGAFSGNAAGLTNVLLNSLNTGSTITWTGVFRPGPSPGTGSEPSAVASADFNGDGLPDLVCVDFGDETVIVFTNNGNGGFGAYSTNTLAAGAGPYAVAVADVNGDGRPDIITANELNSTISILTNTGSGFALATNLVSVSEPYAVVATDINGDSKPDIVAANFGNSTLSVFTNNGAGVFALSSTPATGSEPAAVAVADINGDGRPDLISANYNGDSLSILTNKGGGQFGLLSTASLGAGTGPSSVVATNLNGNGTIQLACVNYNDDTLMILTNNGSGTFTVSSTYNTGPYPSSLAAADLNNDGSVDLVCTSGGADYLVEITNNGAGIFALASLPITGANPHDVIVADLNGDGHPDLVTANEGVNTLTVLYNTPTYNVGTLSVWGGLAVNTNVIYVAVDGTNVGIDNSNPQYTLDVHGSINASGGYYNVSDARFKTNVETVKDALEKIMALRGVGFDWRREEYPQMNFSDSRQLGFLAQEVLGVLPEAVSRDAQGHYAVAYSQVIPVLVEALKEEKEKSDSARQADEAEIRDLEERLSDLQKMVESLAGSRTNLSQMPVPPTDVRF